MKKRNLLRLGVGAAATGVTGLASAALPAGVSTALDDAATDAATVGGLVLVVIIGIAAFKLMRRAV